PRIVIAEHGWSDPDRSAEAFVWGEVAETLLRLEDALEAASPVDVVWARTLAERSRRVAEQLGDAYDADAALGEGAIARLVVRMAPRGSYLMAGNGLAIRHLDTFCGTAENDLIVLAQRGTSGIDGLVSGAAGAASAQDRPVTLLFGDVSLLH